MFEKCRLDFQKSSKIHSLICVFYLLVPVYSHGTSEAYYIQWTRVHDRHSDIWPRETCSNYLFFFFLFFIFSIFQNHTEIFISSNLQVIIPVNKITASTCSVTNEGCSFFHWIKQAAAHHRLRLHSWTLSGEGHFVNNWKNVLAIHCFKHNGNITCSGSHYQFCSSPQRIIHLEQLSVTLAPLRSQREALGNGV